MNESKKIRDIELGEIVFRRIEESKNRNVVTYILETKDGMYAKCQRLRRYKFPGSGRKIVTVDDEKGKDQEIAEMNDAYRSLLVALRMQVRNAPPKIHTLRPVLTQKLGNIHEFKKAATQ